MLGIAIALTGCTDAKIAPQAPGGPTPPAPSYPASVSVPAPSTVTSAAPGQLTFGAPSKVTVSGTSATIAVSQPTFAAKDIGEYLTTKPRNGVFVVFTVSAVGVGGLFDVNPYDFAIRANDGTRYQTTYANFPPQLNLTTVREGEPVKGKIVFDVPETTGTLLYVKGGFGTTLGEWKF